MALQYAQSGLAVFPLYRKRPLKGSHAFKDASTDPIKVRALFDPMLFFDGIGVATGARSGGLLVVDADQKHGKDGIGELSKLQQLHGQLPVTVRVNTPTGGLHLWFMVNSDINISIGESSIAPGVDHRFNGGYAALPPSRHPAGGLYAFAEGLGPDQVAIAPAPAWLVQMLTKGTRQGKQGSERQDGDHHESLDPGVLVDALGYVDADPYKNWITVGMALKNASAQIGDEEAKRIWDSWSKRSIKFDQTKQEYLWDRMKVTGDKTITIGTVFFLAKEGGWLKRDAATPHADTPNNGSPGAQAGNFIGRYNRQWAVVMVEGKCVVLREHIRPTSRWLDVEFCSVRSFHDFSANDRFPDGKGAMVPASVIWFTSKERRQFDGIVFDPSQRATSNFYNLYRGLGVVPREGNWSLMREHIHTVICAGSTERFAWFMAWLARIVQDPGGARPGTSPALRGLQGTGKGIVLDQFGKIIGPHYVHLTDQGLLTGRFNAHLAKALYVFADEAFFAGDKAALGKLKGLVTEDTMHIEAKGINAIPVKNHINLALASNEDWVIPAGPWERRFCLLDVSPERRGDHAYFKRLSQQMDEGGREAMLYDLLRLNISAVNLRVVPATDGTTEQKIRSLGSVAQYWHTCLERGVVLCRDTKGDDSTASCWVRRVEKDRMHAGYTFFCQEHRLQHPVISEIFFRDHRAMCPSSESARPTINGGRTYCLALPDLSAARQEWEGYLGATITWDGGDVATTKDEADRVVWDVPPANCSTTDGSSVNGTEPHTRGGTPDIPDTPDIQGCLNKAEGSVWQETPPDGGQPV